MQKSHNIFLGLAAIFILASYKLTPIAMNTLIDSSGSVYADLHKMLVENPDDQKLFKMAHQYLDNEHLSSKEYSDLIDLHFTNHGMFTGNPINVNIPQSEMYPKSIHKPTLLKFIQQHHE